MTREMHMGDIVRHFKRETVENPTTEYLYKILAFAEHTETGEKLVVYQALYAPFKICARPYAMFMSEVDRENILRLSKSTALRLCRSSDCLGDYTGGAYNFICRRERKCFIRV